MAGGASLLSAASCGDISVSTVLSSGFAAAPAAPSGLGSDLVSVDLVSGLARASFLSPFLSDDLLSDLSAAGSRIATRSLSPSMTTMTSGFSVARMPLAAAAQSAGSPLGWYLIRPETVLCLRVTPIYGCSEDARSQR